VISTGVLSPRQQRARPGARRAHEERRASSREDRLRLYLNVFASLFSLSPLSFPGCLLHFLVLLLTLNPWARVFVCRPPGLAQRLVARSRPWSPTRRWRSLLVFLVGLAQPLRASSPFARIVWGCGVDALFCFFCFRSVFFCLFAFSFFCSAGILLVVE
jgi:hypothetical protein